MRGSPAGRGCFGEGERFTLVEHGQQASRRGEPVGTRVVLLADRPQRVVELRREQQHDQPRVERQIAADQLHADRGRDERGPEHRAQLEHERRHERQTQCAHRLTAVTLADALQDRRLRLLPAVGAERLEPLDDIEEVT